MEVSRESSLVLCQKHANLAVLKCFTWLVLSSAIWDEKHRLPESLKSLPFRHLVDVLNLPSRKMEMGILFKGFMNKNVISAVLA